MKSQNTEFRHISQKSHSIYEPPELAKLLMRPWLEKLLDCGGVQGLKWLDKSFGVFRITWKHYSLRGWTLKDADVFKRWAIHTGKYDPHNLNPARWKTNFRCALNSLSDVTRIEVKNSSAMRGDGAYRVFKFEPKGDSKYSNKQGRNRERTLSKNAIQMMHSYSLKTNQGDQSMKIDHEEEVKTEEDISDWSESSSHPSEECEDNIWLPPSPKRPRLFESSSEQTVSDCSQESTSLHGEYYVAFNKSACYHTLKTLADDEILLFPVEKMAEPVTVYAGTPM